MLICARCAAWGCQAPPNINAGQIGQLLHKALAFVALGHVTAQNHNVGIGRHAGLPALQLRAGGAGVKRSAALGNWQPVSQ